MGQVHLRVGDIDVFYRCRGVIKVLRGVVGDKDNSNDGNSNDDEKVDGSSPLSGSIICPFVHLVVRGHFCDFLFVLISILGVHNVAMNLFSWYR